MDYGLTHFINLRIMAVNSIQLLVIAKHVLQEIKFSSKVRRTNYIIHRHLILGNN